MKTLQALQEELSNIRKMLYQTVNRYRDTFRETLMLMELAWFEGTDQRTPTPNELQLHAFYVFMNETMMESMNVCCRASSKSVITILQELVKRLDALRINDKALIDQDSTGLVLKSLEESDGHKLLFPSGTTRNFLFNEESLQPMKETLDALQKIHAQLSSVLTTAVIFSMSDVSSSEVREGEWAKEATDSSSFGTESPDSRYKVSVTSTDYSSPSQSSLSLTSSLDKYVPLPGTPEGIKEKEIAASIEGNKHETRPSQNSEKEITEPSIQTCPDTTSKKRGCGCAIQ